jgi:type III pantothenate kinase
MIVVGDIGNTETKICLVNSKNKITQRLNLKTKSININLLKKSFKKINSTKIQIKKCLFSSVVPKSFKIIKIYFEKFYSVKCFELKNLRLNHLIKIKVNKKQVGSDRIANALGVLNEKKNHIILDFGTATTFDVLIKNVYHGGVIAPGVNLSLKTLINRASLIPKLNLKKTNKVIGLNTVSAVRSGFFWGYNGLIDNIISLIKKETKKSFKIIITGGFSHLFKNSLKSKVKVNTDITIDGLIRATNLIKYNK